MKSSWRTLFFILPPFFLTFKPMTFKHGIGLWSNSHSMKVHTWCTLFSENLNNPDVWRKWPTKKRPDYSEMTVSVLFFIKTTTNDENEWENLVCSTQNFLLAWCYFCYCGLVWWQRLEKRTLLNSEYGKNENCVNQIEVIFPNFPLFFGLAPLDRSHSEHWWKQKSRSMWNFCHLSSKTVSFIE